MKIGHLTLQVAAGMLSYEKKNTSFSFCLIDSSGFPPLFHLKLILLARLLEEALD